ncbi:helix-turn-helix domain-containing protein [Wolbachia endosymbiont of Ctenocephalides felis wCfeT]|uniref:helix-turn-helix domain-containing protein n=1 Tax=Wolbachia endosymbiont of Ctenocephalides felis wCfeT TaxID=2732593 RepID=UPI00144674F1|nr:helix-turn-helix transcriptional regulator [Wolbachia endosymbiont of Ctenocephalides felis wCfeT]
MNVDYLVDGKVIPHPIDIEVGKRIRELRLIRGMSQDDLGKKVGITFQQIQKYEKGINRVLVSRLHDLAIALGVTVDYFFANISASSSNSSAALHEDGEDFEYGEEDAESKEMLGLVREYRKIKNRKSRNAVYSLIKSLSSPEN